MNDNLPAGVSEEDIDRSQGYDWREEVRKRREFEAEGEGLAWEWPTEDPRKPQERKVFCLTVDGYRVKGTVLINDCREFPDYGELEVYLISELEGDGIELLSDEEQDEIVEKFLMKVEEMYQ